MNSNRFEPIDYLTVQRVIFPLPFDFILETDLTPEQVYPPFLKANY